MKNLQEELESKRIQMRKKYADKYGNRIWDFIERNMAYYLDDECAPHELKELYDEMGLELKYGNFYEAHLQKFMEHFDITKNIVEIGAGYIPVFARKIAHEQIKLGAGTITVYDPLLVPKRSNIKNMHLHRKEFKSNTRIKEFDIITGIYTCDATEVAIESACKNHKDFYISLCDCDKLGTGNPKDTHKYIIAKTERLLNEYDNGTLVVDTLGGNFINPNPILYNKRNR